MRSIGDPNFIYSPWSDGRRRAAGRRAKHKFMRERSDLIGPLLPPDREPYRDSRYKKMGLIAATSFEVGEIVYASGIIGWRDGHREIMPVSGVGRIDMIKYGNIRVVGGGWGVWIYPNDLNPELKGEIRRMIAPPHA